ncbi:MAG: hypothetical protein C4523_17720 [Myxococcales bacterium]|nr:MAG: hypothetical protein C4523_17720 [Myxococcales bacterium]
MLLDGRPEAPPLGMRHAIERPPRLDGHRGDGQTRRHIFGRLEKLAQKALVERVVLGDVGETADILVDRRLAGGSPSLA